jgi:hypothetical protein
MTALLEEIAAGGTTTVPWPPWRAATLGIPGVTMRDLLERLTRDLPLERSDPSAAVLGRVLDSCVEAHVHGDVNLSHDVELLVADPSFKGTPTGAVLAEIGRRNGIPLRWHRGFRMRVEDVPEDFRGPAMPRLARRVAPAGWLDVAAIGNAEASLHRNPADGASGESRDDTLQHLKQLWHVLVHYGAPREPHLIIP